MRRKRSNETIVASARSDDRGVKVARQTGGTVSDRATDEQHGHAKRVDGVEAEQAEDEVGLGETKLAQKMIERKESVQVKIRSYLYASDWVARFYLVLIFLEHDSPPGLSLFLVSCLLVKFPVVYAIQLMNAGECSLKILASLVLSKAVFH